MDQINHVGRPCDSELRFCGAALRFLDTTALGRTCWACWQTRATAPPRFPPAWASRWPRQGRRRRARRQSRASVRPETIRGRDPSGKKGWWMAADGAGAGLCSCCRLQVGSTQLGRAGLAWLLGWTYEAWCWIVVLGMQTQWRSQTVVQDGGMSEVYLAAFLTECVCE